MTEPTLSVTVTNYNYAPYLDQNLESILSQTYDDFEVIIVDNASTDRSLEILRRHAAVDPRIRIIEHATNEGIFTSFREASDACRGRYRVHVDADDWVLEPDAFEEQVTLLEKHPSMAFCYSAMTMIDAGGQPVHIAHPHRGDVVQPGELALEGLLTFNLTHTGMMLRLDAYRSSRGYRDDVPHVADMLLAVHMCETGDVGYIDRSLYAFRQHTANLHLSPQLEVVKREILPVIAAAFDGPLGARVPDARAVRRRVEQNALVHLPWQYIFTGQRRTGWRLYWESVKLRPYDTVVQRATLHLLARTILGTRGYEWLESRFGRHRTGGADE